MLDEAPKDRLHLSDLSITDFRGLKDLIIPKLGRVTLIAGKNGVGKTAVLDAIRVYAARGDYSALLEVLQDRDEISLRADADDDDVFEPDWNSLFFGRNGTDNACILIGPNEEERKLRIRIGAAREQTQEKLLGPSHGGKIQAIKVEFQGEEQEFPMIYSKRKLSLSKDFLGWIGFEKKPTRSSEMTCNSLGPGLLNNRDLARFWDNVALTSNEDKVVESLKVILDKDIERIAIRAEKRRSSERIGNRVMVKAAGHDRPVPLKSLGDGADRVFGIALALVCSRDGFLLIDEVENGIHHSAEYEFWRMVLTTAKQNNVQVFATTHSWDCLAAFTKAVREIDDVEGLLLRIDRKRESIELVSYSEDLLEIAVEQGIEVR